MKINISYIAKKANVSNMTVSRVLNNEKHVSVKTRKKINEIIEESGYQPNLIARSLATRKTMTIGVMIPRTKKLLFDNYISQVLGGITDAAIENNYRIQLIPISETHKNQNLYLNYIGSNLFDGLILIHPNLDDPYITEVAESSFPLVLVNHKREGKCYNFVDTKNVEGIQEVMEYLINKGHKRIAFVTGSLNETNAIDRLAGYKLSLRKNKLKFNKNYVIDGNFDKEQAKQNSKKLINMKNRPTAICCSDDYMAIGIIEQVIKLGLRVPEDIAVVGFDDIEIAKYTKPALTTMAQPMYNIGKSSLKVLLKLISGEYSTPIQKILKTKLIVRESA